MDAYQPSFMLPPNFRFPLDGKIKPGIVLDEGDNGLPDPQEELYDGTADVVGLQIDEVPQFHYSGEAKSNTKIGLWADILSLAEIGAGGERGNDGGLVVDTGPAKISTFSPNKAYIAQLMRDPFLSEYTKRPRRRPVYLITGVMVAESATIEVQKGKSSVFQAKVIVNGEGFGVPVKAGPEFEHEASKVGGHTWELTKPFVLAYALKKIKRKAMGGFSGEDDKSHALWDDSSTGEKDDMWEVEDFVQDRDVNAYGEV
jgi:hypothetical protein